MAEGTVTVTRVVFLLRVSFEDHTGTQGECLHGTNRRDARHRPAKKGAQRWGRTQLLTRGRVTNQ